MQENNSGFFSEHSVLVFFSIGTLRIASVKRILSGGDQVLWLHRHFTFRLRYFSVERCTQPDLSSTRTSPTQFRYILSWRNVSDGKDFGYVCFHQNVVIEKKFILYVCQWGANALLPIPVGAHGYNLLVWLGLILVFTGVVPLLPPDVMQRGLWCRKMSVRLSVCLSVTRRYSIETANVSSNITTLF